MLWSYRKCKETEVRRSRWNQESDCSDNLGQNIWNEIVKSNKIGQKKKSLVSIFSCFLTAITRIKFLEGRLDSRLGVRLNYEFLLIFSNFLRSSVWSCSATLEKTFIPILLYWISSSVLLLGNWTCTKIL